MNITFQSVAAQFDKQKTEYDLKILTGIISSAASIKQSILKKR